MIQSSTLFDVYLVKMSNQVVDFFNFTTFLECPNFKLLGFDDEFRISFYYFLSDPKLKFTTFRICNFKLDEKLKPKDSKKLFNVRFSTSSITKVPDIIVGY